MLGVLNAVDQYYAKNIPPSTSVPDSDSVSALRHEPPRQGQQSAAEALRATVEVEQAQRQNEVQIAELTGAARVGYFGQRLQV